MNKPVAVILLVSILMQAVAACIAFVQWPLALRYRLAWMSISAVLVLMVERRVESLWHWLHGGQVSLSNEIVGFAISILMLCGVFGLRHLFFHLQRQEAKLKRQANIDFLTGVFNRRYFTQQGKLDLARARRYGTPLRHAAFTHHAGHRSVQKRQRHPRTRSRRQSPR